MRPSLLMLLALSVGCCRSHAPDPDPQAQCIDSCGKNHKKCVDPGNFDASSEYIFMCFHAYHKCLEVCSGDTPRTTTYITWEDSK